MTASSRKKKMSKCPHVKTISTQLSYQLIRTKRMATCDKCHVDASESSREMWLCTHCLCCYCVHNSTSDHSIEHSQQKKHHLAVNVHTERFWCYRCGIEVLTSDMNNPPFLIPEHGEYELRCDKLWEQLTGAEFLSPSQPRGLVGLRNLGNTCYMNSALQCLSNCHSMTSYFMNIAYPDIIRTKKPRTSSVSEAYRKLLLDMWSGDDSDVAVPTDLLRSIQTINPSFRGFMQQDTQEFLRCIIDQLHEELKAYTTFNPPDHVTKVNGEDGDKSIVSTEYSSFIGDLFNGYIRSSVRCKTCMKVSVTREAFQDLSLPIPLGDRLRRLHDSQKSGGTSPLCSTQTADEAGNDTTGVFSSLSWLMSPITSVWNWAWSWSLFSSENITLSDCLQAFFTADDLSGDNMYSCEGCKKLRDGIKEICITQLPEVLCIHLKRFRHEFMHSSKLGNYVSFPLDGLDLSKYIKPGSQNDSVGCIYNLTGVICHHGSVGGGHYTAFCRHPGTQDWYEFDDSYVRSVSSETVANCQAYVLFYKRDNSHTYKSVQRLMNQLRLAPAPNLLPNYTSKKWLMKLFTCADPGPISNHTDFACKHGFIRPSYESDIDDRVVALSSDSWSRLHSIYGGGPAVTSLTVCEKCSQILAEMELRRETEDEEFLRRKNKPYNTLYAISSVWIKKWERFILRQTDSPPGQIDNRHIIDTNHTTDKTRPLLRRRSDHTVVNGSVWRYFLGIYGGGPAVIFSCGRSDMDSETSDSDEGSAECDGIAQETTPLIDKTSTTQPDDGITLNYSRSDPQLNTSKVKGHSSRSHIGASKSCDVLPTQTQVPNQAECDDDAMRPSKSSQSMPSIARQCDEQTKAQTCQSLSSANSTSANNITEHPSAHDITEHLSAHDITEHSQPLSASTYTVDELGSCPSAETRSVTSCDIADTDTTSGYASSEKDDSSKFIV